MCRLSSCRALFLRCYSVHLKLCLAGAALLSWLHNCESDHANTDVQIAEQIVHEEFLKERLCSCDLLAYWLTEVNAVFSLRLRKRACASTNSKFSNMQRSARNSSTRCRSCTYKKLRSYLGTFHFASHVLLTSTEQQRDGYRTNIDLNGHPQDAHSEL